MSRPRGPGGLRSTGLGAILADVRATGVSLVPVEHNLQLVHAVADRVVVMTDGERLVE